MSLVSLKLTAMVVIFFTAIVGGLLALKLSQANRRVFRICDAFASGVFIGLACFHLLPHAYLASRLLALRPTILIIAGMAVLGLMALIGLEKLVKRLSARPNTNYLQISSYLLVLLLSIHSLIEGTTLGIDYIPVDTLFFFLAIVAHKGSASFAIGTNVLRAGFSRRRFYSLIMVFSIMTPLGIWLGNDILINLSNDNALWFTVLFNAFAAGNLIYIGIFHSTKIDLWHKARQEPLASSFLFLGIVLMATIAIWA